MHDNAERIHLRKWREDTGLSQQKVADALGIHRVAYLYIERGNSRDLSYERVRDLMDLTGLTYEQLNTYEGEKHGSSKQETA